MELIEERYAKNPYHGNGPYLLGDQISVCDYFTFQTLTEWPPAIHPGEETRFPELAKLQKATEERPGIKKLREEQKAQQQELEKAYRAVIPHLAEMYDAAVAKQAK